MSPEHRQLNLAGKAIDCALFTPPDRPARDWRGCRLLLLHEGLGCIALWRQFPQALANALDEPVLAYSRYGYGQSQVLEQAREPSFMHTEADLPLRSLRQQLALNDLILIGHSDGASIALLHAALHPDGIRGVVVMAPHLFVEPFGLVSIQQAREQFERGDMAERMRRYHRDPRRTFAGWCDVWTSPAFLDWNIELEVAKLRCPVLAIQGHADQYGSMRQIDRIAQLVGDSELLKLDDCQHSPHLEQPEPTLAAIVGFVGRLRTELPE